MSLKIDDVKFGLRNIADDYLLIIDLSEEIYDISVGFLEENFAVSICVNEGLLFTWLVHSDKNVCVLVGR